MDRTTIYVKTAKGLQEVESKSNHLSRSLRRILIVVDGHSTVEELLARLGNISEADFLETLNQLEVAGFIEAFIPPPEPPKTDFVHSILPPIFRSNPESPLKKAQTEAETKAKAEAKEREKAEAKQQTELKTQAKAEARLQALAEAREKAEARAQAEEEAIARSERETVAKALVKIKSRGKGYKEPNIIGRILLALVLLLIGSIGLLHVIPLNFYLADIEKRASEQLGQPVKAASLRVALFPAPYLKLEQVTIGDQQTVTVASVKMIPKLSQLLQETPLLKQVELESINVTQQDFKVFLGWWEKVGGPQPVRVMKITFKNVKLNAPLLPSFNAKADFGVNGYLQKAEITSEGGNVGLTVIPAEAGRYQVNFVARGWQSPLGPKITFDELFMDGVADKQGVYFSTIVGKLYQGTLKGEGSLKWRDSWSLVTEFEANRLSVEKLLSAFVDEATVTGRLDAHVTFEKQSGSWEKLLNTPRLKANFKVQDGQLSRVDLVEMIQNPDRKNLSGGKTRFDSITGSLLFVDQKYQFSQLKISAGQLDATGYFSVYPPNSQMTGRMLVELKSRGTEINMPVNILGTTKEPILTADH